MNNISTLSPLIYVKGFFINFINNCGPHYLCPSGMWEVALDQLYDDMFINDEVKPHVEAYIDGFTWDGMIITDEVLKCLFQTTMMGFYQISWTELVKAEDAGRSAIIKLLADKNPAILRRHLKWLKETDRRWYEDEAEEILDVLLG